MSGWEGNRGYCSVVTNVQTCGHYYEILEMCDKHETTVGVCEPVRSEERFAGGNCNTCERWYKEERERRLGDRRFVTLG